MTLDNELDLLMQSLTDEELGALCGALPEADDEAAAARIAARFYAKQQEAEAHAAVLPARHGIRLKILGIAAAACVAVAASVTAFLHFRTTAPGVILPAETTVAVQTDLSQPTEAQHSETTAEPVTTDHTAKTAQGTQTEAVTTQAASEAEQASETQSAGFTTQSTAQSNGNQTVSSESAVSGSQRETASEDVPDEGGSGAQTTRYTGESVTTTASKTSTRGKTTSTAPRHTATTPSATRYTTSRITTITTLSSTLGTKETTTVPMCTTTATCATSWGISGTGFISRADYAACSLLQIPGKIQYSIGEELSFEGLLVSAEYYAGDTGALLQYLDSVSPLDYPDCFMISTDYDPYTAGNYTVTVEYNAGDILGRTEPAESVFLQYMVIVA